MALSTAASYYFRLPVPVPGRPARKHDSEAGLRPAAVEPGRGQEPVRLAGSDSLPDSVFGTFKLPQQLPCDGLLRAESPSHCSARSTWTRSTGAARPAPSAWLPAATAAAAAAAAARQLDDSIGPAPGTVARRRGPSPGPRPPAPISPKAGGALPGPPGWALQL